MSRNHNSIIKAVIIALNHRLNSGDMAAPGFLNPHCYTEKKDVAWEGGYIAEIPRCVERRFENLNDLMCMML